MTFKALTDDALNFFFRSNLHSTEETMKSNICLEYIYGELYPFTKPLPVRYKQSESFISIDYKPPHVLRDNKDVGNRLFNKTPGETGGKSEPNKDGYPNSTKIAVFIEHYIAGHKFILSTQQYVPNDIIGCTFLLLPQ